MQIALHDRVDSPEPQFDAASTPSRTLPDAEVTIADVARAAGVSPTTVSHALSGNRPVSAATIARVRRAADELGYRPNPMARGLRTRRTQTAALVIPDITNPFYPMLARGLQDVLSPAGYHVFVCNTDQDADLERDLVLDLIQRRVDGIVLNPFGAIGPAEVNAAIARGIWMVSIGPEIDHDNVDLVEADERAGARDVAQHLASLGHTRVAHIGGTARAGREREQGFRDGLAEAGLELDDTLVVAADWTSDGGVAAMERLLDAPAGAPTAVFAANDMMAIGALNAVTARGLRVPEDLSIVGFDDIDAAAHLSPPLTTVLNPAYAKGEEAGRLVLSRLAGRQERRRCITPCSLVERQSTTHRR